MKLLKHCIQATVAITACFAQTSLAITLSFDGPPSGNAANTFAPVGWSFDFGIFAPSLDGFGDPIPSSDHWQIDTSAPTVLAEDPTTRGYGAAPSPKNALNGVDQTILLTFSTPLNLLHFSTVFDDSSLGNLGPQSIDFYSATDTLLYSLPVDETVRKFVANFDGTLPEVSKVVFPNNAYFDNLSLNVPDSGNTAVLVAMGLGCLAVGRAARSVNQM